MIRTVRSPVAILTALALAAGVWLFGSHASAEPRLLRVGDGQEFATIQAAVDAANAGDFIFVEPGTYDGDVVIPEGKEGLTIRGRDRNGVVLDGKFEQKVAITALADNVTMENMTARNFTGNGFYWRSVDGYEGRYLTTYRVGLYGIYAFDSVNGRFEKSLASGSGDAAFYIGQCRPCDAVIDDVIGEWSALGYSGTNAGGNLTIQNSVWRLNGAGIMPNSLDSQRDPPQRGGSRIINNLIEDNGNAETPGKGIAGAVIGHGVGVAGGADNVIENNVIRNNSDYGVVIFPIPGGSMVYLPNDNTVQNNVFENNGAADMALSSGNGTGNCFSNNEHTTTAPANLEQNYPCHNDGAPLKKVPIVGDAGVMANLAEDYIAAETGQMERPSYQGTPIPDEQPSMPNPEPEGF
ncbi:MAG TPA: right-handed parallel beta-helix repeat-containing protein [Egibacteraceae bacterium]|nr:right-handed parallel beta-helix repeat-containing protein [Egibacteraceae bacterium]